MLGTLGTGTRRLVSSRLSAHTSGGSRISGRVGGGEGEWPEATSGGVWGGGTCFRPHGVGSGEGLCPSSEKKLK